MTIDFDKSRYVRLFRAKKISMARQWLKATVPLAEWRQAIDEATDDEIIAEAREQHIPGFSDQSKKESDDV